jgi:cobalt/nickel transport system permease protein
MKIPEWLKKTAPLSDGRYVNASANRKKIFVSKTLFDIARLIERSVFSEKLAKEKGMLQKINPKIKIVVFLLFIITVSLVKSIEMLVAIYLVTFFAAIFSRIPVRYFLIRVWLFIPLFSGIIAFPAIFNILTPGNPIATLINLQTPLNILGFKFTSLSITTQGIMAFAFFVLRVGTIVSLTIHDGLISLNQC